MAIRKLKQHTVTLQVSFLSADRKKCEEDAESFGDQLDNEYEKLMAKFKPKSEAGLSKLLAVVGPKSVELEDFTPPKPSKAAKGSK